MKRSFTIVGLVVVATLLLAACGGGAAGGGTIKVATQSPLSGGQSAIGVDIKNGAELALEQLSGPLKDMGFKVELAPFDDQANPDNGVANAKQIVSDPGRPVRRRPLQLGRADPFVRGVSQRRAWRTSRPPTPTPR